MSIVLTVLVLSAPFALAAALSWAAHRSDSFRFRIDQFRFSAPMVGRLFDESTNDRDNLRVNHDLDAIRSRFEDHPSWPVSGVLGERR